MAEQDAEKGHFALRALSQGLKWVLPLSFVEAHVSEARHGAPGVGRMSLFRSKM